MICEQEQEKDLANLDLLSTGGPSSRRLTAQARSLHLPGELWGGGGGHPWTLRALQNRPVPLQEEPGREEEEPEDKGVEG